MSHPFALVETGDPENELKRRVWSAQAAELLPLIEVRRRDFAKRLERQIPRPFRIDRRIFGESTPTGEETIDSLDELEIGTLAHLTRVRSLPKDLRDRAEWLAYCRNKLAHLNLLEGKDALDSRLHG
jgi:hypothetical protein